MSSIAVLAIGVIGVLATLFLMKSPALADRRDASPAPAWTPPDVMALINEIAASEAYGRPELARAIAKVESSLNPAAFNMRDSAPLDKLDSGDSIGVMGIKLATARGYVLIGDYLELFDARLNILAGVRFLADLERKWRSTYGLRGVVQMYNLGETRFRAGERSAAYLDRVSSKLPAGYL